MRIAATGGAGLAGQRTWALCDLQPAVATGTANPPRSDKFPVCQVVLKTLLPFSCIDQIDVKLRLNLLLRLQVSKKKASWAASI